MWDKGGFVGIFELIILLLFFGDFRRFFAVFDIHFHGELSPHYRRQTAFFIIVVSRLNPTAFQPFTTRLKYFLLST